MASSDKKVHRVAVLVFNGTDILDFAGPLEMLSHTLYNTDLDHPEPVFKPTVVARYTFFPTPLTETPISYSAKLKVERSRRCSRSQFEWPTVP